VHADRRLRLGEERDLLLSAQTFGGNFGETMSLECGAQLVLVDDASP
jgi:hypothetical protein